MPHRGSTSEPRAERTAPGAPTGGRTLVAVVFGAGGGLGAATATALVDDGWAVVAVDVAGAAEAAAVLRAHRDRARDPERGVGRPRRPDVVGIDADPAQLEQVEVVVAAVAERFGSADAVVNLTRRSDADASGAGSVMPAYEAVVGLNWWAQVHVAQAFLPAMVGRGRGTIVLNAAVRHGGTGTVLDFSPGNERIVQLADSLRARLEESGVGLHVVVVRHRSGPGRPSAETAADLVSALVDGRPAVWTTD